MFLQAPFTRERTPKGSLKDGSLKEPLKVLSSIYQRTLLKNPRPGITTALRPVTTGEVVGSRGQIVGEPWSIGNGRE